MKKDEFGCAKEECGEEEKGVIKSGEENWRGEECGADHDDDDDCISGGNKEGTRHSITGQTKPHNTKEIKERSEEREGRHWLCETTGFEHRKCYCSDSIQASDSSSSSSTAIAEDDGNRVPENENENEIVMTEEEVHDRIENIAFSEGTGNTILVPARLKYRIQDPRDTMDFDCVLFPRRWGKDRRGGGRGTSGGSAGKSDESEGMRKATWKNYWREGADREQRWVESEERRRERLKREREREREREKPEKDKKGLNCEMRCSFNCGMSFGWRLGRRQGERTSEKEKVT